MKALSLFCLVLISGSALAESLPMLPGQEKNSPHKVFVSTQTQYNDSFDTWKFDSGYAYSVFDSVDLYVGARFNNSGNNETLNENGFLSGVSYQFSEKVVLQSTLHTKNEKQESGERGNVYSAEVSSRVKISEHLDLHATLDYEEWQQGFEVGLGFRF
ncbi:ribonuclease regulator [Vibrio hannami]|uniref:ribonuclease regulator n=1 Tax=Vibrio hannami TaxID=2717094 RepID=UPI00240FC14C|nr:ribonuclease regulator [Vibrio hannami]MDG3088996.1 ribonuclease regulator [Vibrio hannami]